MAPPRPRASLIVPVRDGAETIEACLVAARAAMGQMDELIVVDDGSSDGSAALAAGSGARVIFGAALGAAAARNAGAAAARGRWLVFLDADVLLEPGSLEALLAPLETGRAQASIGAYAPCPPELGLASRVKDRSIRHRHHQAGAEIAWFWTGLGAVDRDVFEALGGFDAAAFTGATVEDMELGYRLARAGHRIRQVERARGRHLHRHSIRSLLRNDFTKSRAWTRSLLSHGTHRASDHASTHPREALALACALLGLLPQPTSPAAWAALGWLLRAELATARRERGLAEALAQLGLRGLLYPAAALGSATALLADRRSDP
jgi:glycosyltransferase involved in cell wall biosynthesis